MALLAGEHTSNHDGQPDREYLWFAVMLIALLVIFGVQIGLSSRSDDVSTVSPQ